MNWTQTNTNGFLKGEADRELKKIKKERKGLKTRLIKICDKPLTFKEVPIED